MPVRGGPIRDKRSALLALSWSSSALEIVEEITHVNPFYIITLQAHIVYAPSCHSMLVREDVKRSRKDRERCRGEGFANVTAVEANRVRSRSGSQQPESTK